MVVTQDRPRHVGEDVRVSGTENFVEKLGTLVKMRGDNRFTLDGEDWGAFSDEEVPAVCLPCVPCPFFVF
jgi:hypothetical protein